MKTSGRHIDVRVSVIPTIYGEKVVMRILDATAVKHDLEQLGLEPNLLEEFKGMLARPHGIMIVTGPTGSGKSTTLYSALNYVKDPTKNITTVEDPVEYRLGGINQIQIKPEIELDFAKCLRAILRQDPDIILIGEIRDKETVEIAIKASLTGHLVLSTFHTNDAPSAISRLLYMGIERYLLASSLNLVVAQRLVRKICDHCKEPVKLSQEVLQRMKIDPKDVKSSSFYHGKGCSACSGTGYLGRLPIFEFLVIDDEIRELIVAESSEAQIREASRNKGYGGLLESGVSKALAGLTTAEEVIGVAYTG
jgi:type IV pilus assembly protein PilB